MGLFDEDDVQSEEMDALLRAQTILSTCSALQTLLETPGDASSAKSLIVIGSQQPPLDGEAYTVGELEGRIAWCQLIPRISQQSFMASWNDGVGSATVVEGFFFLHIRRQVRESEYMTAAGRNDPWKYFLDQTSSMCVQYVEAADYNLLSRQAQRISGPDYNTYEASPAQGRFLFADFLIPWGGKLGNQ